MKPELKKKRPKLAALIESKEFREAVEEYSALPIGVYTSKMDTRPNWWGCFILELDKQIARSESGLIDHRARGGS